MGEFPSKQIWEKMGQDSDLSILILTEMSGYVMKNQLEDLIEVIFKPQEPDKWEQITKNNPARDC